LQVTILKKGRYVVSSDIVTTLRLGMKMRLATRLTIRLTLRFLRINP
jgi:hypothetical protein